MELHEIVIMENTGMENETERKILLLEDEKVFGEVASFMLNEIGWNVQVVRDGADAVSAYIREKERGMPFAVVILDVNIPGGMGGDRTIHSLLQADPGVRAIASSGQVNHPVMQDFRNYGFVGILPKPYTIRDLDAEISNALSG